jgi:hypothetical protein
MTPAHSIPFIVLQYPIIWLLTSVHTPLLQSEIWSLEDCWFTVAVWTQRVLYVKRHRNQHLIPSSIAVCSPFPSLVYNIHYPRLVFGIASSNLNNYRIRLTVHSPAWIDVLKFRSPSMVPYYLDWSQTIPPRLLYTCPGLNSKIVTVVPLCILSMNILVVMRGAWKQKVVEVVVWSARHCAI